MKRAWLVFVLILLGWALPAQALLVESTPERVLFLGYPANAPDLTVKMVRRQQSYGIYLFHVLPGMGQLLTRRSFVGLVEGSLVALQLDQRAAKFFRNWYDQMGRFPEATEIGGFYRYQLADSMWLLEITVRTPLNSWEVSPGNLVSQFYCQRSQAVRLEKLSRAIDPRTFQLRDRRDLFSLVPN